MTNDTSDNDPLAQSEPSAHRFIGGRAGRGSTLTSWLRAHRDEQTRLIDPKADDEDMTDGGGY